MGNAAAMIAALSAVGWLVWWLTNRHPADQKPNHPNPKENQS